MSKPPLACDRLALSAAERTRHFEILIPKLRSLLSGVKELENGYEFKFPGDSGTFELVDDWVAGEHLCCPFLDINLKLDRELGLLWMTLTGPEGAKQLIRAELSRLFGAE